MSHYTPDQIQALIDAAAREQNILPLTSRCDSRCVFCSHRNNPPHIKVISIGTRTLEQIKETIGHLDPSREITIGESASSIIEGEPTLHPNFKEAIEALRAKCPAAPVSITTNGHHLTEALVSFLAQHGPVQINLSLNSGTLRGRQVLMGDSQDQARRAIEAVALLERYHVPFQGSLVGMMNLISQEEMEQSIRLLADHGAQSVRVFLPGFSSFAPADIFPDPLTIYNKLARFISSLSDDLACPVLLEPSFVSDLSPVLSGVTVGSPAHRAGLRRGDLLLEVNGKTPRARTEAFSLLHAQRSVAAKWRRGDKVYSGSWENGPMGAGVTLEYDFDLDRAVYIKNAIHTAPGHVLALNSQFGHKVFRAALEAVGTERSRYTAIPTENKTFGGTIQCAGLLTTADYLAAYEVYIKNNPKPAALLVPGESFNTLGLDLAGVSVNHISQVTGLPVAVV